jgi:ankyrin repeat protein/L-ascorbate metabolism protein UlaG (beta-lactamase superfamily)
MTTLLKKILWMLVVIFLLVFNSYSAKNVYQLATEGNVAQVKKLIIKNPALLNGRSEAGRTALQLAAFSGQVEVVALLLEKGADVNMKSIKNKRSPLHFAVWKGHTKVAHLLLKGGADLESKEVDGETPLHYAAASGELSVVKLLVAKGAKVNYVSRIGTTPLSYAVSRRGGFPEIIKFLIAKGADAKVARDNGWTMLHEAGWEGKPEVIQLLLDKGISADVKTSFGRTPLQNACMAGNLAGAKILIKNGADPNAMGKEGWSPLILATNQGRLKMVDLLLNAGVDVNLANEKMGITPLHLSSVKGYGKITAMLLEKGAKVNARDKRGRTPLFYACRYGHERIAKHLAAKGGKADKAIKHFGFSPLLTKTLPSGNAAVWYLGHSGWAIKTQNHFLVFDYFKGEVLPDEPHLANGNINIEEIKDLPVTVFVSHSHGDHYMPAIFEWRDKMKHVTYVLGLKVDGKKDYIYMAPRSKKVINDMKVMTIKSNDSGVGFYIRVDGVDVFHSGDHANRKRDFSGPFKAEIDFLADKGLSPDIFFAPVSGCGFGDLVSVKKGVYYTVKKLKPRAVFPMHAGEGADRYINFALEARKNGIRTPMCCAEMYGDLFFVGTKGIKGAFDGKAGKLGHGKKGK